ncbi:6-phosphogluconate dehydrogenase C-terminal domain-like protein [Aspergillus steynii IBT 23096]|uniref:6-phosphogluconate dehydrogenase C-terminal domain-like protein n=1 Tax=Aspergillus steynii IBT 23096 TaxID=1392250 RepID=A0A2I2GGG8_9EURO|nr:6-phosphogluconate dehydrogenase C-terminal domain-like protein [Aspergillus steynii IBT 23096]PLB51972.1 6-phosphogluconate dehydrogenase C-terminal domain-like protein [Aspergillus steynii IBT 23096]
MIVELMTCGDTDPDVMVFMKSRQEEIRTIPYVVRRESSGFIINRIWAAIKRETLSVLAEGVSTPAEIDELWGSVVESTRPGPCRMMDEAGLDTVAAIEENYINERGLPSIYTTDYLRDSYLSRGKLGAKCHQGGFYPPEREMALHSSKSLEDSCGQTVVLPGMTGSQSRF